MGCSSSNPRAEDERARDRAREALILDSKNLRVKLVLLGATEHFCVHDSICSVQWNVCTHSDHVVTHLLL